MAKWRWWRSYAVAVEDISDGGRGLDDVPVQCRQAEEGVGVNAGEEVDRSNGVKVDTPDPEGIRMSWAPPG